MTTREWVTQALARAEQRYGADAPMDASTKAANARDRAITAEQRAKAQRAAERRKAKEANKEILTSRLFTSEMPDQKQPDDEKFTAEKSSASAVRSRHLCD
jgi:hypothetical protein